MNDDSAWRPLEYKVLFGIVGGLGPMATVDFCKGLVDSRVQLFRAMTTSTTSNVLAEVQQASTAEWTLPECHQVVQAQVSPSQLNDQDHIPVLIAQATTVPPRPTYILGQSFVDPKPHMVNVCEGLIQGGATHLAVVCNTAHYFWPEVCATLRARGHTNIVFVDMLELAVQRALRLLGGICEKSSSPRALGLLATEATLKINIYQDLVAKKTGLKIFSPLDLVDGQKQQERVQEVIFGAKGIKSGFDSKATNPHGVNELLDVCRLLVEEKHVEAIILGCTELPLLLNNLSVAVKFVDPTAVLVDYCLRTALLTRG
jgi:aspartate racemase